MQLNTDVVVGFSEHGGALVKLATSSPAVAVAGAAQVPCASRMYVKLR
jgi:hypothetical protein